ncbi:MAG: hypothetical protein ACI8S6_002540 [Myxococcota bacterium]|jgi:hypothetical protein
MLLSMLLLGVAMSTPPVAPDQRTATASGVTVSWHIEDGVLHAIAEADSPGWICVGLSDERSLGGTRLVMGWANQSRSGVEEHIAAPPDHAERVSLGRAPGLVTAEATQDGGRTVMRFSLRLDTGDERDPRLAEGAPVHLVLAWSHSDDLQHHSAERSAVDTTL